MEHPPNKDETRYQYPQSLSSETQILRHQNKNKIINTQENMSVPETTNSTTIGPGKSCIVKPQDKEFKRDLMNIFKDLKEYMNKYLNSACKNTNSAIN